MGIGGKPGQLILGGAMPRQAHFDAKVSTKAMGGVQKAIRGCAGLKAKEGDDLGGFAGT